MLEQLTVNAVGNGLQLSSKLDAKKLNITPKQARELASDIENEWFAFANNPLECDLAGRHSMAQLAAAAFECYLRTGEVLALLDWRRLPGARYRTKLSLLDNNQLDFTKTLSYTPAGSAIYQGVEVNGAGRVTAYWIHPLTLGHISHFPMAVRVPAFTSFGRQKVIHLLQLRAPGQLRGISPLAAALTPAHENSTLAEFTLSSSLLQTMYALTVESDLPPHAAMKGLQVGDEFGQQGAAQGVDPVEARLNWYKGSPVDTKPGVINFLAQGDKLKMNRPQMGGTEFESFDSSLKRQAATAAGANSADLTGDYSEVNFSASRMLAAVPHRINERRRNDIAARFYAETFKAWLQEAIETGQIALPRGAPQFWQKPDAYCEAKWIGSGIVQPDPLKAAQATALELQLGLTTLTDSLAARGKDLEQVIAERKNELELIKEAGLPVPGTGAKTARPARANPDSVDPDGDEPLPIQRR